MSTTQTTATIGATLAALAVLAVPATAQEQLLDVDQADGTDVLTTFSDGGFLVQGERGTLAIPIEGAGTRMMWYPGQAAFRVGQVGSSQWDNANVGAHSVAMGRNTIAGGNSAFAMGNFTAAYGNQSVALGSNTIASGASAFAMGNFASTDGHVGAFVYGDLSRSTYLQAAADNQFAVRAQHFWLGTDNSVSAPTGEFLTTSTGAYLSAGGSWTDASSRASKENLTAVEPGAVLEKVAELPVKRWNYRAESTEIKHIGPTAEAFHAAFGLGADNKHIAPLDVGGVSLLSIQALKEQNQRQADRIAQQSAKIEQLRAENADQALRIESLRDRMERLEALVEQQAVAVP